MTVPQRAMETVSAEGAGAEVEDLGELVGGAGDDGGVEAEEESAEGADQSAADEESIQSHRVSGTKRQG